MRKVVFSLLLIFGVANTMLAQEPTERMRPVAGDMGIGFKLSGIADVKFSNWKSDQFATPQLLYRYYVSDKFAIRAGLGLNFGSQSGETKSDVTTPTGIRTISESDSSVSVMRFSIDPGIEYHLTSPASRVDPYVGFVAMISYQGTTQRETKDKITTFDNNSSVTVPSYVSDINVISRLPGGIGFGGDALIGFNYFFSDNFSIGAEYMLGYQVKTLGGEAEITTSTSQGAPNSILSLTTTEKYTTRTITGNASVRSTGGINVSVFW